MAALHPASVAYLPTLPALPLCRRRTPACSTWRTSWPLASRSCSCCASSWPPRRRGCRRSSRRWRRRCSSCRTASRSWRRSWPQRTSRCAGGRAAGPDRPNLPPLPLPIPAACAAHPPLAPSSSPPSRAAGGAPARDVCARAGADLPPGGRAAPGPEGGQDAGWATVHRGTAALPGCCVLLPGAACAPGRRRLRDPGAAAQRGGALSC
jgi:hypothetical protein